MNSDTPSKLDNDSIEKLISKVLAKGVQPIQLFYTHFTEQQNRTFKYHSHLDKEALDELVAYLKSIPSVVEIFDHKSMNTGNGASSVTIESLARWLTISALDNSASFSASQLEIFLSRDDTPATAILAVSGIEVIDPIWISTDIQIVPFDSLPATHPRDALYPPFLKHEFLLKHGFMPFDINGGYSPPKSALLKDTSIFPQTYSKGELATIDITDLYEVCEFLTLLSDATPVPVGSWVELKDNVPCKELLGSSWNYPIPDVLSTKETALDAVRWKELAPVFRSFSGMTQANRDLLRVPIQRINQARRRKKPADKAIDQGIAFEALFLSDRAHKEELSFTLRLRASLLLGNTLEERQSLIALFAAFYNCRSQAVHTGYLDEVIKISGRGKCNTSELLQETDALCICAIVKIIENGGAPDWTKLMLAVGINGD